MSVIEEIGTDARSADGYVVVFKHGDNHTGVLAVPATPPKSRQLTKLEKAVTTTTRLGERLKGFKIEPRTMGKARSPNVYEITFAVKNGNDELIGLFLEYARQSCVLMNPIVSDMRDFKLR